MTPDASPERSGAAVPANRVRSIMRVFASDVEDKAWFHDRDEWSRYLDFMAETHWSRVHLAFGLSYDFPRRVRDSYLYFAYPFLIDVPGFSVHATNLRVAERASNLDTLRWISDACAQRGLDFQLGLWTHQYQLFESPDVNHTVEGLSEQTHAPYCRAAIAQLLRALPSVTGVTLRVHGESGIAEGSHDFWSEVFAGVVDSDRRIGIDLHAKGIEQPLIDRALATGLPVTISPKYWAEHMGPPYHQASIRPLEQAGKPGSWESGYMTLSTGPRRFTRYGYADLLREDRSYGIVYRIWPGTQRLLLWGDPVIAAGYGRLGSFCDAHGVEVFEPLSFKGRRGSGLPGPRSGYADESLRHPEGDWAKYKRFYRLFGTLLHNPDASPDEWRHTNLDELGADGPAGLESEKALAYASRILPLVTVAHLPSAANNSFWPELYTNQPIVDESHPHPYTDTLTPKLFTHVSPLDPQLFTNADQFAEEVVSGKRTARYSPLDVARRLDTLADTATAHLVTAGVQRPGDLAALTPAMRRLAIDVLILGRLGRFFAGKLRAGVAYALYSRTRAETLLREGRDEYESAIGWWRLAASTAGAYESDLTFGPEGKLRGHWTDRLPAFEADVANLSAILPASAEDQPGDPVADPAVWPYLTLGQLTAHAPPGALSHSVPQRFVPGEPLPLTVSVDAGSVRLLYRHANQAQVWQSIQMAPDASTHHVTIPAAYTDSPYPLQYYFEVHPAEGRPWLHPGLDEDLANQPYYVVRLTHGHHPT